MSDTPVQKGLDLAVLEQRHSVMDLMLVKGGLERLWQLAVNYSNSAFVPEHFRGQAHIPDCFIALTNAYNHRLDPLLVMQNMYIVKGQPAWKATYMIALANSSGRLKGPIHYEVRRDGSKLRQFRVVTGRKGDNVWTVPMDLPDVEVRAYVTTGDDIVEDAFADMQLAAEEGWATNSKYHSQKMAIQMLKYRAATFLVRLICPEVLLGMQTVEELEDITGRIVLDHPLPETPTSIEDIPGLGERADHPPVTLEKTALVTEVEAFEELLDEDDKAFNRNRFGLEPDTDLHLVDATVLHRYRNWLEGDTSEEADVLAEMCGAADEGKEVLF